MAHVVQCAALGPATRERDPTPLDRSDARLSDLATAANARTAVAALDRGVVMETQTLTRIDGGELSKPVYVVRGFLPKSDPLTAFPLGSPYAVLDEIGRDLPSLLHDAGFRDRARGLRIPLWRDPVNEASLPALRLYSTSRLSRLRLCQSGRREARDAAAA